VEARAPVALALPVEANPQVPGKAEPEKKLRIMEDPGLRPLPPKGQQEQIRVAVALAANYPKKE
jgi:hypothetical protein